MLGVPVSTIKKEVVSAWSSLGLNTYTGIEVKNLSTLLSKHQEPQSYLAEQTVKQAMTVKLIRVLLLPEPFAHSNGGKSLSKRRHIISCLH